MVSLKYTIILYVLKRGFDMFRYVFLCVVFCNILYGEYLKSVDSKNVYYSSEHFSVVAGKSYENSILIRDLAYKILDFSEISWGVLVDNLGFRMPRNSQNQRIKVFIGDRSAWDDVYGIFITIGSNYAGWANYYDDGTPYFVINPRLSSNDLKVTISHEFFHTLQMSYFDADLIEYNRWRRNIWWLEATAMMAEDEVWNDLNSYIGYMHSFFSQSYRNIETFNGIHEYSMVIFAKYIKERFGLEIIKESFSIFEDEGFDGFFEIICFLVKRDFDMDCKNMMKEFGLWVSEPRLYFEEGNLYPSVRRYEDFNMPDVQKGGVVILQNYSGFFVKTNLLYTSILKNKREYVLSSLDDEIIIVNYTPNTLSKYDIYSNHTNGYLTFDVVGFDDLEHNQSGHNIKISSNNNKKTININNREFFSGNIQSMEIFENEGNSHIKVKITNASESIYFEAIQ